VSRSVNLEELERYVLEQVESYRYEVSDTAVGRPASQDWVVQQLAELRTALVKPEWRLVMNRDMPKEGETPEVHPCALVAKEQRRVRGVLRPGRAGVRSRPRRPTRNVRGPGRRRGLFHGAIT
jgi:hypothetical protein